MIITFRTEIHDEADYWSGQLHAIIVDGKEYMSQAEFIEPEDVCFGRDLTSPHEVDGLLRLIVDKVKSGEEVEFAYETVNVDD